MPWFQRAQTTISAVQTRCPDKVSRDGCADMILIIAPDLIGLVDNIDALSVQLVARANAGQHQQFRAVKAARCENNFTPCADRNMCARCIARLDRNGTTVFNAQPAGQMSGQNRQVFAIKLGFQKTMRCGLALTTTGRDLIPACARLLGAVEIIGLRHPRRHCRGNDLAADRMRRAGVIDHQLPLGAVIRVAYPRVRLLAAEHGQNIFVSPSPTAMRIRPVIIISMLPAHVDHAVHR